MIIDGDDGDDDESVLLRFEDVNHRLTVNSRPRLSWISVSLRSQMKCYLLLSLKTATWWSTESRGLRYDFITLTRQES